MLHLKTACASLLLLAAASAKAFGDAGHLAVGEIADRLLAGTPAGKIVRSKTGGSLHTAAIWADCARAVKNGKYDAAKQFSPSCKVSFESAGSKQALESFVKRNGRHTAYHYVNLPYQLQAYDGNLAYVQNSGHDIVDAINAAIAALRKQPVPPPFRIQGEREAIRLLAHFVGDIHQPLHVANVYLAPATGAVLDPAHASITADNATFGGNYLLLAAGDNLHTFWDALGPHWPGVSALLEQARAVPETEGPIESWAAKWAAEALEKGKPAFEGLAYSPRNAEGKYRVTLPAGYAQRRDATAREQVAKAGARLAQILRRIYGSAP